MLCTPRRATLSLLLILFQMFNLAPTRSQSPELIFDRIAEGKLDLLASQTAKKIREAPVADAQSSILVMDFFRNSAGTSSRLGSLLADRYAESLGTYSEGFKIIDREILKDHLAKEWTTLEDLQSQEVCFRIGRQLGATGVILGTLAEDKTSINLTLKIEGLGPKAKIEDLFPRREMTASFLLSEDLHRRLMEPGPNYARSSDDIPAEPGVVNLGSPGVTPPSCDNCPAPEYSDAARVAKYQGKVTLSIVVTAEGQVTSIYVLKGAPFGLTSKAIEAIQGWHFKPALKDGKPISVRIAVESTWRSY